MSYHLRMYPLVGEPRDENMPEEEAEMRKREARLRIEALYNDGVPLFTKDALRDLQRQLKSCAQGNQKIISVKGLDGEIVQFEMELGQTEKADKPELEYIAFTKELVQTFPSKAKAKESFMKSLHGWEMSETCQQLRSILTSSQSLLDIKISKIVAFACGTLDVTSDKPRREAPSYQHGLILTLHEILSSLNGYNTDDIKCFSQDPAYTNIDCEVLGEFNINTVDDPEGFLEVDDTTVLISCAPDVPVKQIIADIARPAIIIWDDHTTSPQNILTTDPPSSRVSDLIRHYSEVEFPKDWDNFKDFAIYVRRAGVLSEN